MRHFDNVPCINGKIAAPRFPIAKKGTPEWAARQEAWEALRGRVCCEETCGHWLNGPCPGFAFPELVRRAPLTSRNHKTSKAGIITREVIKALRPLLTAMYDQTAWVIFDPFSGSFSVATRWHNGQYECETEICCATVSTRSLLYAWQGNRDLSGLLRECLAAILSDGPLVLRRWKRSLRLIACWQRERSLSDPTG